MQRLIHTIGGAGCRAGLLLRDAHHQHYLLTCGHPFQTDQPFATSALGKTRDSAGRRVIYARLRAGSHGNAIDAALIETAPEPGAPTNAAEPTAALRLNQHKLTVTARNVPVQLAGCGFPALTLATGAQCHRGESGSLVTTEAGQPCAIVAGMLASEIVLCELKPILVWFNEQGLGNLTPLLPARNFAAADREKPLPREEPQRSRRARPHAKRSAALRETQTACPSPISRHRESNATHPE
jgi:hypothetical protein